MEDSIVIMQDSIKKDILDFQSIILEEEDQESSEDEQEEVDSLQVELSDYIEEAEEPISESTVSKRGRKRIPEQWTGVFRLEVEHQQIKL